MKCTRLEEIVTYWTEEGRQCTDINKCYHRDTQSKREKQMLYNHSFVGLHKE